MPLEDEISIAYARWRLAYARACRHDRVKRPHAELVRFSSGNPHIAEVNAAAIHYFNLARKADSDDRHLV
jgi:hypothetical protein